MTKTTKKRMIAYLENQAQNLTEHPVLQEYYDQYLKLTDTQKRIELKQKLYSDIESRPEEERKLLFDAIDEANIRLMQRMMALNNKVQKEMASAKKKTDEFEFGH